MAAGDLSAILGELDGFDSISYSLELAVEDLMDRGLTQEQAIEELRWVRLS